MDTQNNENQGKKFLGLSKSALIVLGLIVILVIWCISKYNGLVKMDEDCKSQWSKVETQYQRRLDLIPNLVNTVKGYASHEEQTLLKVIEARNNAMNASNSENQANDPSENYQKAQNELSSAIKQLNVVIERYPDLKANENFLELQSQLEGTENRISVERSRYAEFVNTYNQKRRSFPTTFVAGIMGFDAKQYYASESGAEKAPNVNF